MKRNVKFTIISLAVLAVVSCSTSDPYVPYETSGKRPTQTRPTTVDSNFDSTEIEIVDFIAKKVKENPDAIKKVTVDSLQKLQNESGVTMTKREFLARAYQIIRDEEVDSYYLAVGRLLNQLK